MIKNKKQAVVFGLLMSYSMAYGMEVYNCAIKNGIHQNLGGFSTLTGDIFWEALLEALYMGLIVFVLSNVWGNPMGARFMKRYTDPEHDNVYFCQLMRQAGTVAVMCPTMSLVASILFNVIMGGAPIVQLPAIWIGTLIKNFPMAFFWNMFGAAPFSRWVFGKLFPQTE